MDWLRRSCCFIVLMGFSAVLLHIPAHAQVAPSAYRATQSLWVGAEYSNVSASFPYESGQRLSGVGSSPLQVERARRPVGRCAVPPLWRI